MKPSTVATQPEPTPPPQQKTLVDCDSGVEGNILYRGVLDALGPGNFQVPRVVGRFDVSCSFGVLDGLPVFAEGRRP